MDITEARDDGAFRRLRAEWQELVDRSDQATIYQTWEWNDAWWTAFGGSKRLILLELRECGDLVGIAPFYVSRHLGTPLRRLALVGTGASDYLDVISAQGREQCVTDAVLRWLAASRDHDMADLQQLRPDAGLLRMRSAGTTVEQEPCPCLPLVDGWDGVARRLGKKMRSNIGYYERLLGRTYADLHLGLAGPADIDAGLDALFDLHQRRWRARLLPGVLGSSRVRTFHREVASRFLQRDWLRLHLMRAEGRIVAALHCFRFGSRYYYYLGGFDPSIARLSPGTVLTACAIRNAIDERCTVFDFLRGAEPYKYRWQPECPVNVRLLVPGRSRARSQAMLRLNRLERTVEHRAKEFAEKRGRRGSR